MHLAIEYMIRNNVVREWFATPCTLFLAEIGTRRKTVVTINEEFKRSTFYSVKHWMLHGDQKNRALPPFVGHRVPKTEVFVHQAVVVPAHRLMDYHVSPIPFEENTYNRPMTKETYDHFYDTYFNSYRHREKKINWLWSRFVEIHLPQFCEKCDYIPSYKSEAEIAAGQRNVASTQHPAAWRCWEKWCKNMLCLKGTPGELVFLSQYR